jgi:hypothetical protein
MAYVWQRRANIWVLYGRLGVQTRKGRLQSVHNCVLVVRIDGIELRRKRHPTYNIAASNDFGGLDPVSAWNIQMCDFGTYCCRALNDRRNCCNNSTAPRITTSSIGAFQLQTATAVSSSTSTSALPAVTATNSPSDLEATLEPNEDVCKSEKHKTAVVGGALGGILGAAVLSLMAVIFWMYKRERRQRKLKEHYEEQFSQTWAYRKAMGASNTSIKNGGHEEWIGKLSEN